MEKNAADKQLKRNLAFDLYGRYAVIRDIINTNRRDNEKFKVLDVGGRGNLMRKFIPDDDVFYLDPYVDTSDDNYIEGNGCDIPLEDNSFDWVVSADVFEHIKPKERENFLNENIRVSKLGTILAAPFYSKEVKQAEINANENYKILSGGKDHRWLKEHIENGLPSEKNVEEFLRDNNYEFQKLYNNRLFLWQLLIDISLNTVGFSLDKIQDEYKEFNYFYNTKIFPYDFSEPSYRKIYFIKKNNQLRSLEIKEKPIDGELFLETISRGLNLVSKVQVKNSQEIQRKDQEIENLSQAIQGKDQKINFMESSQFWKVRNRYLKLKSFNFSFFSSLAKKGYLVFKKDGFATFLKYLYKYIIHGRDYFKNSERSSQSDYEKWIEKNEKWDEEKIENEIKNFKYKPKISIITPVYNVDPKWLNKCIESVKNQFYENWELCLHDDASTNKETIKCLKKWNGRNKRVKISYGKKNQHISGASNEALKLATGEFITLLDNDDELSPNALYENAKLLNKHPEADFIYSDEDKIAESGKREEPFFKPDWSPDLFLSMNYTCHLGVYRKSIIDKIDGFRKGYEGSQDYDLVLRFIEKTKPEKIFHIPKILYHWRKIEGSMANAENSKKYTYTAAKKALSDYLNRNEIMGDVSGGISPGTFRIKRKIKNKLKVSIIIPFKDQMDVLKTCVDSIFKKTIYDNYEIILVNNQSKGEETADYLRGIKNNKKITVLSYDKPFNFSAINNFAVKRAKGEYVLFLNNDTEVINEEWLSAMVEHIQRKEVGVAGAKLVYPNGTIQHAGVIMGLSVAGHAFKHLPANSGGYFSQLNVIRNYNAVTAACMLTKKKLFEKLGGFNEKDLSVAYNDVDLCLRIRELGYLIVYTPYSKLYHYESLSRGNDEELKYTNPKRYERVIAERKYMTRKWREYIKNDTYYNPNLTRKREDFSLNLEQAYPCARKPRT